MGALATTMERSTPTRAPRARAGANADRLAGPLTPARALDLQRTAGNAAVASLVQRAVDTSNRPTLRRGSKGPAVVQLQQRLGIGADGDFGPATDTAVRAFQKANGLGADGVVGPRTWASLGGGSAPAAAAAGPAMASPDKVHALLKAIHAKVGAVKAGQAAAPAPAVDVDVTPSEPVVRNDWLDDAGEWVGDKAEEAGQAASDAANAVGSAASDAASAVGDAASSAASAVGDAASDAAGAVGGAASAAWDAAGEAAGAAATWAQDKASEAGQWVGEKLDEAGEAASSAASWAGDQASAAAAWVGEQAEAVKDAGASLWEDVKEVAGSVAGAVGDALSALGDVLAKIASAVAGVVADIEAELEKILKDLSGDGGGDDAKGGEESGAVGPFDVVTRDRGSCNDDLDAPPGQRPLRVQLDVDGTTSEGLVGAAGHGRDDKLDATLTMNSTVTNDLPVDQVVGAGKEVPTFSVGRSEWTKHDDGSVSVFGVVDLHCRWAVSDHGHLTDVASADSAAVTAGTWVKIVEDLQPNANGWPQRDQYWVKDISSRHEQFHANDDRFNTANATKEVAGDMAGKYVNPSAPIPDQVTKIMKEAVTKVEAKNQEKYLEAGEARAYALGKSEYDALVEAIKARAKREGWSGTPGQPKAVTPNPGAKDLVPEAP
jgi:colicin import membrane protein